MIIFKQDIPLFIVSSVFEKGGSIVIVPFLDSQLQKIIGHERGHEFIREHYQFNFDGESYFSNDLQSSLDGLRIRGRWGFFRDIASESGDPETLLGEKVRELYLNRETNRFSTSFFLDKHRFLEGLGRKLEGVRLYSYLPR